MFILQNFTLTNNSKDFPLKHLRELKSIKVSNLELTWNRIEAETEVVLSITIPFYVRKALKNISLFFFSIMCQRVWEGRFYADITFWIICSFQMLRSGITKSEFVVIRSFWITSLIILLFNYYAHLFKMVK